MTPGTASNYEQGFASGLDPKSAAPPIPRGDSTWAARLFNRGWLAGRTELQNRIEASRIAIENSEPWFYPDPHAGPIVVYGRPEWPSYSVRMIC